MRVDPAAAALGGKNVILVDDGLATGSTMSAAIARFRLMVDEIAYLETPEPFRAVGDWYIDFGQVTDEEIVRTLALGRDRPATHSTRRANIGRDSAGGDDGRRTPNLTYRGGLMIPILAILFALSAAREQMLVSTEWLHANAADVRILHVGDRAGYDAGHIPGAVLVEASSLLTKRDDMPNELPPVSALEEIFRAAGVGSTGRIVIYSSEPIPAARAWFTLDHLGHGERASILDGGYAKWVADGYAVTKEATVVKPAPFEAKVQARTVIDIATLRGAKLPLLDARPAKQFSGEEPGADVRRGGHIPGAANVPFAQNLDADGQYLPVETLRAMYEDAGASKESANVAYCRTGMQASLTYFVLKYLGYDAALYDPSFIEWSRGDDPIER